MVPTETLNPPKASPGVEQRVLIAAPTGCDAEVLCRIVNDAGFETTVCPHVEELCREVEQGAAAAILAEEVLNTPSHRLLVDTLLRQPEWSDLPLIVMAAASEPPYYGWQLLRAVNGRAHAILLQRPVRKVTLLSSVRAALQSRARQYQVRDELLQRQRAEEALRDADRRKDEFLATLAHELRNPLAPLRSALALLKLSADKPETFDQTREMMERQLSQMVRLIDDLLDVSRISRGRIELRRKRVELASVIYQAVEACRSLAEREQQEIKVTLPPQPIDIDGDPVRLVQIFANLINNSCKYTKSGGKIWINAECQDSDVVISIKDTGVGIPSDKLDSIFEMFSQVDHSLERAQGGLGIGLTLVKRLVELHGGAIVAHSAGAGSGSEFIVRLPILARLPNVERPPVAAIRPIAAQARRVLVVEDNRDAARSLSLLLNALGNQTHVIHDGAEAVEAARAFRPDLILLDLGLPKMNGYDACRAIRREPWGKDIVIVALTGWGQDDYRRKSKEAGFDGHLVKPVEHSVLLKLLSPEPADDDAATF